MADLHRPVEHALTLAEHRALEAKRLVTPNNGYTPPRRTAEKENH